MVSPDQQRAAADYLDQKYGVSQRRICRVMDRPRSGDEWGRRGAKIHREMLGGTGGILITSNRLKRLISRAFHRYPHLRDTSLFQSGNRTDAVVLLFFVPVDECADSRMCSLPGRPHRRCPLYERGVPFATRFGTEHVSDGYTSSLCRRIEGRPLLRLLGEVHMRPLNILTRITMFQEKAKADQSECNRDILRVGTCMLGCIGVHGNLMDEERIAVRQRVE